MSVLGQRILLPYVPLHEEPRDTKIRGKNGEISNAQCIKTKKLILKDLNFKRRKK